MWRRHRHMAASAGHAVTRGGSTEARGACGGRVVARSRGSMETRARGRTHPPSCSPADSPKSITRPDVNAFLIRSGARARTRHGDPARRVPTPLCGDRLGVLMGRGGSRARQAPLRPTPPCRCSTPCYHPVALVLTPGKEPTRSTRAGLPPPHTGKVRAVAAPVSVWVRRAREARRLPPERA
jgi:hypothetical protein